MKKIYFILSLTIILFIGATYEEVLNDKNKQIDVFKKEIEDSRNLIKSKKSKISDTQKEMDSVVSEINMRNDFLKDYENQKFLSPDEITKQTDTVLHLEDEVNKIQDSFRNKIVNLYKHGKNYELELLLSAKNPNEYLRRNEYLQKFSQSRKKELRDLKSKKFILSEKKKMLALSVSSQRFLIESRRNERNNLDDILKGLQDSVANSEKDITNLDERILFKENQVQGLSDFINNFTANKKDFKSNKYSRLSYATDDFNKLKGSLNLPVDLGIIRNNFGDYVNNSTNSRIANNGIDFNISRGSRVYAVSTGTVTLIGDVPFYGKVIIITHDNDFRTVYASVSEVDVELGDKVHLNQIIAKSGETFDGQGLHFEIWQGKTPLNPREWIRFQ